MFNTGIVNCLCIIVYVFIRIPKQLVQFICLLLGGLIGQVAYETTNQSLIQSITCNGTTHSISDCIINEGSCTCSKAISLDCYGKRIMIIII